MDSAEELLIANCLFQIEDQKLSSEMQHFFRVEAFKRKSDNNQLNICGDGESGYSLEADDSYVEDRLTKEQVLGIVLEHIELKLMQQVRDNVCLLHGASTVYNNGLVTFLGKSGSGKTSLSIAFSDYGAYVGDEYTFFNIATGDVWYEPVPAQIKAENTPVLSRFDKEDKMYVVRADGRKIYLISWHALHHVYTDKKPKYKLQTVVFSHHTNCIMNTEIRKMPPEKLPVYILESLIGNSKASVLLKQFLELSSQSGFQYLEISYFDSVEAAKELKEYLDSKPF